MRIQIVSDLHHETAPPRSRLAMPLRSLDDVDALVLAGDIAEGTNVVKMYGRHPVPVLYVHGNHEPMHHCYPRLVTQIREMARGTSVTFLEKDELHIGNVRFLGACLWTNYELNSRDIDDAMNAARRSVTDYRLIFSDDGVTCFQPEDARLLCQRTLIWLTGRLKVPFAGKTVVVTHHLPSSMSIPARYRAHRLAPAYASPLEYLVEHADLWIHGHAHFSSDYRIGRCRVVCNPRGRPGRGRFNPELAYENAQFDPTFVVEI